MSGIKKRTLFFDNTGNVVRFTGWASVVTGLGQMAEPFFPSVHTPGTPEIEFEFDDQIARVDEMKSVDIHKFWGRLSSGSNAPPHTGGHQVPRTGP